jgi:hypothetical protein
MTRAMMVGILRRIERFAAEVLPALQRHLVTRGLAA